MAKMKMRVPEKETSWYDNFKPIKSNDWSIEYNQNTARLELKNNNIVVFSDINLQACKNIALSRHSIDDESWTTK